MPALGGSRRLQGIAWQVACNTRLKCMRINQRALTCIFALGSSICRWEGQRPPITILIPLGGPVLAAVGANGTCGSTE